MHPAYKDKPRKLIGSNVIFLNKEGDVLLEEPTYRDDWLLPGGIVELGENPYKSAKRETREELGLELTEIELVAVGAAQNDIAGDLVNFIFYGGVLSQQQIESIHAQATEVKAYHFLSRAKIEEHKHPKAAALILAALDSIGTKEIAYVEDGVRIK